LGDAILKAAPGQLTAETLKQREQYLKEEEKIEAQIKSINEQRQKEIEALRIAVELTERMSKMNAETAEVTSGEVSLTSGIDNNKLAQRSINKVGKGLSSEGFAITKDKGNKSVNLNASLKNYEKLIKL
jgi:hypothetical protein